MRLLAAACVVVMMVLSACTSHDSRSAATPIPNRVTVPDVRGSKWSDASRALVDLGFSVEEHVKRFDDFFTAVLGQDHLPDTAQAPLSPLRLVVDTKYPKHLSN